MSTNNNIVASSKSLTEILDRARFRLDYFQREYKWERTHFVQLLDDLDSAFNHNWLAGHTSDDVAVYNSYYMGPIIVYKKGVASHIIDGQQRITSLTLLLIFLKHLQKEIIVEEEKWAEFDTLIFSKHYGKSGYNMDVETRIEVIDKLYRFGKVDETDLLNDSCFNIADRYQDLAELFPPRLTHPEVLPLFIYWLISKLLFVVIEADTDDNAYTIFETMNDRGLRLTSSEMLKSHLLSHVKDNEEKIKELDELWKEKIGDLHDYSSDEDDKFFKAWLRGKYAVTIRKSEKDAVDQDFEKIGNRFHSWVKEFNKKLGLQNNGDYYTFVKTDLRFFADIYMRIADMEMNQDAEHILFLQSSQGVADSLLYPLLLSPITILDNEETVNKKILVISKYTDAFTALRLITDKSISQPTIRNYIYNIILAVRNKSIEELTKLVNEEYKKILEDYKSDLEAYIPYKSGVTQYLLARLTKYQQPDVNFSSLIYKKKSEHMILTPLLTDMDIQMGLSPVLIEKIKGSSINYCLVPKSLTVEVNKLSVKEKINFLLEKKLLYNEREIIVLTDLTSFFASRNKHVKELILKTWAI